MFQPAATRAIQLPLFEMCRFRRSLPFELTHRHIITASAWNAHFTGGEPCAGGSIDRNFFNFII